MTYNSYGVYLNPKTRLKTSWQIFKRFNLKKANFDYKNYFNKLICTKSFHIYKSLGPNIFYEYLYKISFKTPDELAVTSG